MYLKRSQARKTWPLVRKGMKYIVRPKHNLKSGLPLLMVLRDILKLTKTKNETKKLLNMNKIKINYRVIKDEKFPLSLFDVLGFENKNLKLILKNKKFRLMEVKGKEAEEKIAKVVGKKILKKNKLQINLSDGRNYLFDKKVRVGDSVVINLKENKISEVLPFKHGCKVFFVTGKHIGKEGAVEKIDKRIIMIKIEKEKINSRLENLMVVK